VRVMYPWPLGEFDSVMDEALDMALDYPLKSGQANNFKEAQAAAASAIDTAVRCKKSLAPCSSRDPSGGD
jgi:hypothetical protein